MSGTPSRLEELGRRRRWEAEVSKNGLKEAGGKTNPSKKMNRHG